MVRHDEEIVLLEEPPRRFDTIRRAARRMPPRCRAPRASKRAFDLEDRRVPSSRRAPRRIAVAASRGPVVCQARSGRKARHSASMENPAAPPRAMQPHRPGRFSPAPTCRAPARLPRRACGRRSRRSTRCACPLKISPAGRGTRRRRLRSRAARGRRSRPAPRAAARASGTLRAIGPITPMVSRKASRPSAGTRPRLVRKFLNTLFQPAGLRRLPA